MSSFVLKLLAILFMCCDHIGKCFFPEFYPLYFLGALSFPLFAFQVVQGYSHTSNFKKYIIRLLIFAVISQLPFMLFLKTLSVNAYTLNIFFTLILGLLSIYFFDKPQKICTKIIGILVVFAISIFIPVDYGFYGVLLIFTLFVFRNNKLLLCSSFAFIWILKTIPYINNSLYIYLCIFRILSIILILLYNGKQGLKTKSFFYVFYPIHLSIIYLLYLFI